MSSMMRSLPFNQVQVASRAEEVRFRTKARRVDDERIAVSMAARVSIPRAHRRGQMRTAVQRNDPRFVDRLHEKHQVVLRLNDLVVGVDTVKLRLACLFSSATSWSVNSGRLSSSLGRSSGVANRFTQLP